VADPPEIEATSPAQISVTREIPQASRDPSGSFSLGVRAGAGCEIAALGVTPDPYV